MINHFFIKIVPSLFIVLIVAFIAGFYVSGWTEPTVLYPGGNIDTPLNTGITGQTKLGGLRLNTNGATNGLIVEQGYVGIGVVSPTQKLDVNGNVKGTGLCIGSDCRTSWPSGGGGEVPSGAVMFFNLASCPTGWTAVAGARGRYIVGLPSGGTLGGTAGTALSNLENRSTGNHSHSYTDRYIEEGYTRYAPGGVSDPRMFVSRTDSLQTSATGVNGTNAPYIQFLVCQKN